MLSGPPVDGRLNGVVNHVLRLISSCRGVVGETQPLEIIVNGLARFGSR